jgi:ABC-2 type transport system permease protein
MWTRLLRAEWMKITGHRRATGGLIWIFPALAVLATILGLLAAAFSSSFRTGLILDPVRWTDTAVLPWLIPNNPLGRVLLLGFTAVLFAGEYQWDTWKSIVPRTERVPLILIKFATMAVFVVFAFTIMSILLTFGIGLVSSAAGASYGPPLSGAGLASFSKDYGLQMAYAFVSTVIAAGFVALSAMITRSILGTVITSFFIALGETLLVFPLYVVSALLDIPGILHVYRFLPSYNLLSLFSWLQGETPEGLELPSGASIVDGAAFSEIVLVCWMIGLTATTAYLFYRQDI